MTPQNPYDDLLPKATLVLLCATVEESPTALALHLAHRIATAGSLVLVAGYNPPMTAPREHPNLVVWKNLCPLDEPPGPVELAVFAHERRPALIIVDCLYDALNRADIHRAGPARKIMRRLAHLTTWDATVLIAHFPDFHRTRPFGSPELVREADLVLIATRDDFGSLKIRSESDGRKSAGNDPKMRIIVKTRHPQRSGREQHGQLRPRNDPFTPLSRA